MLLNTKELYGAKLAAIDGEIGQVQDFFFDDQSWVVRYLVANTGTWLSGRLALLSPHAFGRWDKYESRLHVKLRRQQIEDCPLLGTDQPPTRQTEIAYYQYYGWPAYWNGGAIWGPGGYPLALTPAAGTVPAHSRTPPPDDRPLHSALGVAGYEIQATDGTLGTVSGLLVDDRSWAIRELVVETGHWYAGKQIMIAPARVDRISYSESKVFVNLTQSDIRQTANHEVVHAGA